MNTYPTNKEIMEADIEQITEWMLEYVLVQEPLPSILPGFLGILPSISKCRETLLELGEEK